MMSTRQVTELPDIVYGAADVGPPPPARVKVTKNGGLIHAFIGPIYVGMSAKNWAIVLDAIDEQLRPTHTIVFDDVNGTATVVTS